MESSSSWLLSLFYRLMDGFLFGVSFLNVHNYAFVCHLNSSVPLDIGGSNKLNFFISNTRFNLNFGVVDISDLEEYFSICICFGHVTLHAF